MNLADYLAQQKISDSNFAEALGVSRQAVHRYRSGERIPEKHILPKIYDATGGTVTANDFFDLPATPADSAA